MGDRGLNVTKKGKMSEEMKGTRDALARGRVRKARRLLQKVTRFVVRGAEVEGSRSDPSLRSGFPPLQRTWCWISWTAWS